MGKGRWVRRLLSWGPPTICFRNPIPGFTDSDTLSRRYRGRKMEIAISHATHRMPPASGTPAPACNQLGSQPAVTQHASLTRHHLHEWALDVLVCAGSLERTLGGAMPATVTFAMQQSCSGGQTGLDTLTAKRHGMLSANSSGPRGSSDPPAWVGGSQKADPPERKSHTSPRLNNPDAAPPARQTHSGRTCPSAHFSS